MTIRGFLRYHCGDDGADSMWRLAILLSLAVLPASAETLASGQGRAMALDCAGQAAVVRGNANRITFAGRCAALRVEGDGNVVDLTLVRGGTVGIVGNTNHVYYAPASPPPFTTTLGYYDDVRPGPAPVELATLLLDGTQAGRDVRCDGRDVIVRESAARYVLRGGCRSLTIQGERDTVAAELLPGARIVVGGAGVVVNYVLVGDGAPPQVVVTGRGLQAAHLSRSGETSLRLPTLQAP